jgi:3-oxoacyl-ACP reductase-like protein
MSMLLSLPGVRNALPQRPLIRQHGNDAGGLREGPDMSVFGAIKNAIFGHPAAQAAPAQAPAAAPAAPTPAAAAPAPAAPAAPEQIDVDATLTRIAEQKGETNLDWQHSIVDLMKLIGQDSSLANREELATELGYTGAKDGSAEMNLWLHDQVMNKLRNG